ncbi:hypothetical protein HG530_005281 [Fusarium avenaceum]|nr:hypothetical protein HG530_005281 [Fusarium avenaceum]
MQTVKGVADTATEEHTEHPHTRLERILPRKPTKNRHLTFGCRRGIHQMSEWRMSRRRHHIRVDAEEKNRPGQANRSREEKSGLGTVDKPPQKGIDQCQSQRYLEGGRPGHFALQITRSNQGNSAPSATPANPQNARCAQLYAAPDERWSDSPLKRDVTNTP